MEQKCRLSENEKNLLTALGNHPDISTKELFNHTTYKWSGTVTRKIEQFKRQKILLGPVYYVDLGKLSKNTLCKLFCIIETNQNYETAIKYLRLIEPLIWVYPVLSSHKELLAASFLSSDNEKVKNLLQLLKDSAIITDYVVRTCFHPLLLENPDFFGDPVPSLDNLLDPCDLPDASFGCHDTDWTECDIRTLSYLHGGFKSIKLIDILRKERRSNRIWTYEQIKYSFNKMVKNKLIWKIYYIHPYPLEQCADFYLFIKTDERDVTKQIVCNFAKGERIHREYTLYEDWGLIGCVCHPAFLLDLMHKLDNIKEIKTKEVYHIRSFSSGVLYEGGHAEFNYFDVETQTLEYPYRVFEENIKENLEKESD